MVFYHSADLQTWTGPFRTTRPFDGRWDQYAKGGKIEIIYALSSIGKGNHRDMVISKDTGKTWTEYEEGIDTIIWYDVFKNLNSKIPSIKFLRKDGKLLLTTLGSIYINSDDGTNMNTTRYIESANIKVYPNPADGFLRINSESKIQEIQLLNPLGQKALQSKGDIRRINVSSVQSGNYIVQIETQKGLYTQKVLILH